MADDIVQRVLATISIPPPEEDTNCTAGLCGQKPCCLVEMATQDDPDTVYALALCAAHALRALQAPVELAERLFPPEEEDVPPWDREDDDA